MRIPQISSAPVYGSTVDTPTTMVKSPFGWECGFYASLVSPRYLSVHSLTLTLFLTSFCLLTSQPWQFVSVISPIFVACLIIFVSGIRLLEISSQKKYGHRADFQQYVRTTSKYFLLPPFKDKVE